jgi:hypothetical protein
MRSLVRALAAFGLAVAAAAPAHAATAPGDAVTNENLVSSGTIGYSWQGDPGLGCAAVSLCSVQGAITLDTQGPAVAQSIGRTIIIDLEQTTPTVRVLGGPGSATGECIDTAPPSELGALFIQRGVGGGLVARFEPPLSSQRCAGPLTSDLSRVTIPVRKTGAGGRVTFDLRASEPFVAGPFSGALSSTLVLRPARGSNSTQSGGFGGSFFLGPHPHRALIERVRLRYAVASLPGVIQTTFAGESDPFCATLNSCGATGTVGLSIGSVPGSFTLVASRRVTRRVGARQALADLRRGRLALDAGELSMSLSATETFVGADGSRCQESSANPGMLAFGRVRARGAVSLKLVPGDLAGDVLRTYCPGPSQTDVFGTDAGESLLADGSIGVAQLLRRESTITLASSGGFSGTGYEGSSLGELGLALSLEHVSAGTIVEKVG